MAQLSGFSPGIQRSDSCLLPFTLCIVGLKCQMISGRGMALRARLHFLFFPEKAKLPSKIKATKDLS